MNTIISAERSRMLGGTMYIAGRNTFDNTLTEAHPCKMCRRAIINAGIKRIVIRKSDGGIKEILIEEEFIKNL